MDNQQDKPVRRHAEVAPPEVEQPRKRGKRVLRKKAEGSSRVQSVRWSGVDPDMPVSRGSTSKAISTSQKQDWGKAAEELKSQVLVSGVRDSIEGLDGQWMGQMAKGSGLCNRLRGWASLGAVADIHKYGFAVHWRQHRACANNFSAVFVADTCVVLAKPAHVFAVANANLTHPAKATHVNSWYADNYFEEAKQDNYLQRVRIRMMSLKLLPQFDEHLEAFMETLPPGIIGVHIRRTDFEHDCDGSDRTLIIRLQQIIDNHPDTTFLVCADTKSSIDMMRAKFGDRVYWREQNMSRRGLRRTSTADAAIDVYTLSRTKRMVGVALSSFALYAAQLGGIELIQP